MTDRSVIEIPLPGSGGRILRAMTEMTEGTRAAGALRTREALLDAGTALAEERGLAGLSVNMVVARAGVAKGTFYVHFKDRAAFVDAMHARFHARAEAAVGDATAGLPPGAERLFRGFEAYLDVSLANRGVKALSIEARSDPAVQDSMEARRERLAAAGVADVAAMGWDDVEAAAQLLAAMTREVSVLEFDAGHRLPASRRALKRFLGI
jgi:TetR/AcrR family transcriptional regulator, transcriptional repressor for nem operon